MQIEIAKPCPPHQWAHAPTVGYFRCQNCGECVCIDDPRYADLEHEQAQNYAPEPINSAALDELAQIDRDLIDVPVEDGLFPDDAWQELTEYDDRTSPAEYPDMAFITFDELASFMARAHPNECSCMEVVGENPDCVVHGALTQEVSALEAALAAKTAQAEALAGALEGMVVAYGYELANCPDARKARAALSTFREGK